MRVWYKGPVHADASNFARALGKARKRAQGFLASRFPIHRSISESQLESRTKTERTPPPRGVAVGKACSMESADGRGELSVLVLLVALVIWSGHELKARRVSVVNQGSLALMTGLLAGAGFFVWYELGQGRRIPTSLVAFKYDLYMILLSPIIFYSGFSIKKKVRMPVNAYSVLPLTPTPPPKAGCATALLAGAVLRRRSSPTLPLSCCWAWLGRC